jgi:hypothetical protein
MVTQLASGKMDLLLFDAGHNDPANEGVLYASNLLALIIVSKTGDDFPRFCARIEAPMGQLRERNR